MGMTTRPGGSCAWSRDPNRARQRFLGTTRLVRNAAAGSFRHCGTWHHRWLVYRGSCIARTIIIVQDAAVASTQDGMLGTRGAVSAVRSVGSAMSVIGSSTQSWKRWMKKTLRGKNFVIGDIFWWISCRQDAPEKTFRISVNMFAFFLNCYSSGIQLTSGIQLFWQFSWLLSFFQFTGFQLISGIQLFWPFG